MSEREKRIARDPTITLPRAIQEHGYYDINGNWNPLIQLRKYPNQIFRHRVEVLIFDDKNNIFVLPYAQNNYRLPGGGVAKGKSKKYQVAAEAREEARIILGNIIPTNVTYVKTFSNIYDNFNLHWDGTFTVVYAAEFKHWYSGNINKSVRDDEMCKRGKFIPYHVAMKMFSVYHKKAAKVWIRDKCRGGV